MFVISSINSLRHKKSYTTKINEIRPSLNIDYDDIYYPFQKGFSFGLALVAPIADYEQNLTFSYSNMRKYIIPRVTHYK